MADMRTTSQTVSMPTTASGPFNTFPGTVLTTTLLPTETAVPTLRRPEGCGTGVSTPDTPYPACAGLASDDMAAVLNRCCNNAPRVVYSSNCNIFCEARNQTLEHLNDCILRERAKNNTGILVCNRAGVSFSSLLPVNTETRGTGTPTGSVTGTAIAGAATWLGDKGVSKGAWAAVGMVVMSAALGTLV